MEGEAPNYQSTAPGHHDGTIRVFGLGVGRDRNKLCPSKSLDFYEKCSLHRSPAEASKVDSFDEKVLGETAPLLSKNKTIETEATVPSLRVWVFPALGCAAAYSCYNVFIKEGSNSIHPILGGVILQFVAALLGVVILGAVASKQDMKYNKHGLIWSCCAGFAVGCAEILSYCVSGFFAVPVTHSLPIITGGNVLFGAVMSILILGERLMLHGWCGVALLVIGITLVATDPGKMVGEGARNEGSDITSPPPILIWIGPALICAISYSLYNIFIRKSSASINPILGGVVLQFVAAIFGTILVGVLSVKEGSTEFLNYDCAGIIWSCCAGVAVGAAELLFFILSFLGVPASLSIPTVIGGSVLLGALLGLLMLGETLLWQGWFGIALLMVGIGFVATDGEKAVGH